MARTEYQTDADRTEGVIARFIPNAYRGGSNALQEQINRAMDERPEGSRVVAVDVHWNVNHGEDVACVVVRWERQQSSQ